MNWSKFNPFEEETTQTIDVAKPLANQIGNKGMTNSGSGTGYNVVSPMPTFANAFTTQPQLSEEDKKKWMDFLTDIYATARKENSIFDEFENQVDALATVLVGAPDQQKIAAVGAIMKQKGITKQNVLLAANNVMTAINSGKDDFEKTQAAKLQSGVTTPQQQIADKQKQITDLQNEIGLLTQTIAESQNIIATRAYGFNSCYSQIVAKMTQDINNITNYVIE